MDRYYARRKAAGLCTQCGKRPPAPGILVCAECRERRRLYWATGGDCDGDCERCPHPDCVSRGSRTEAYRESRRERIELRKAAGICAQCGRAPAVPGRTLCTGCRDAQLSARKATYDARVAAGICPRCGRRPPAPGSRQCAQCLEKQRGAGARRQAERAAAGMCVACGKRPPAPGRQRCAQCLGYMGEYRRRQKDGG